eukprot:TRINITY_DN241_c1_g1_i1.p2 TRINITY_DN241_c1_g1~~TRINITY_DN241_c1_g1_i1.p2  ORF type:complete len:104 (+),score=36.52 TRINITY_DN241_c1_g1_i1:244-555(+)
MAGGGAVGYAPRSDGAAAAGGAAREEGANPVARALTTLRHGSTAAGLTLVSLVLRLLSLALLLASLGCALWLQQVAMMQEGLYSPYPLIMATTYAETAKAHRG